LGGLANGKAFKVKVFMLENGLKHMRQKQLGRNAFNCGVENKNMFLCFS
jgi:hypothetical protein